MRKCQVKVVCEPYRKAYAHHCGGARRAGDRAAIPGPRRVRRGTRNGQKVAQSRSRMLCNCLTSADCPVTTSCAIFTTSAFLPRFCSFLAMVIAPL